MAGDWLKVEHATPDKPEIFQIAEELGLDPENVFAKIVRVWIWFDVHSEDGTAPVTLRALLDRKAGVTGFSVAMENAGWLEEIDVSGRPMLFLPNFDRHVGKSAKKRALTARRVLNHKKGNAKSNAASVNEVTPPALAKALPREEKRRSNTSPVDRGGVTDRPCQGRPDVQAPPPPEEGRPDFSDFKPRKAILDRIRMSCPDITDAFIEGCVPEFLTYAEANYRRDQLENKFLKSVVRDWKQGDRDDDSENSSRRRETTPERIRRQADAARRRAVGSG